MPIRPTCPSCDHPDVHSPLAGCMWSDGDAYCSCTARWSPPKTHDDARREADAALAQVARGTDPRWQDAAERAVVTLAARVEHAVEGGAFVERAAPFTTDDVWDLLRERGAPECREPRALGTIMREAAREGMIVRVGYVASRRRRQAPVPVYAGIDR